MQEQQPLEQIEELLRKNREQGYIRYPDLMAVLDEMVLDAQELQQLYDRLEWLELDVLEDISVPTDRKKQARDILEALAGEKEETRTLIGFYLDEVVATPPLDMHREENFLARAAAGEQEARNALCEAYLPWVVTIAQQYMDKKVSFLDLIQEGSLGLIQAVERFDPAKGYTFASFAPWPIRLAMLRYIADMAIDSTMPDKLAELVDEMMEFALALEQQLGREPTLEELADEMGVSPEQIEDLMRIAQDQVEEKEE